MSRSGSMSRTLPRGACRNGAWRAAVAACAANGCGVLERLSGGRLLAAQASRCALIQASRERAHG